MKLDEKNFKMMNKIVVEFVVASFVVVRFQMIVNNQFSDLKGHTDRW